MHTIEVPVTYKNENLIFNATFLQTGYTYKFEVNVNGIKLFFEPDEEQNYRAFVDPEKSNTIDNDWELVKKISTQLIF